MLRTLSIAALAALAACVTQPSDEAAAPPADRDCFNTRMVNGYNYIDENHIGISVGANRRYILTTMFNAHDLDWTQQIALRSTSNWICTGNGLGVELIGGQRPIIRNYPVSAIERAPDEAPAVEGS